MAAASGKEERKAEWPVWPALSLEHVAADEAKIKGEKEHRANVLVRFAGPRRARCVCIYVV